MEEASLHHIEMGVEDGPRYVQFLTSRLGLRLEAVRTACGARQWLLTSHAIRFLVTQRPAPGADLSPDPYLQSWGGGDSVFNVALRVSNVQACLARLTRHHVTLVKPLTTLRDGSGMVTVCTVRSCVGNVVHTLVQDTGYSGLFLPGFQPPDSAGVGPGGRGTGGGGTEGGQPAPSDLTHVDHLTFCVPSGSMQGVLAWYESCFAMKRFFINRDDSVDEGFVIRETDVGLRLTAMDYWKCAESGLSGGAFKSVKFVVAEALANQGPNQMDFFLERHGGAGVQHVGLHCQDIVGAVSRLHAQGVQFNTNPPTYYTKIGRLSEIVALGLDVSELQKYGILIDTEDFGDDEFDEETTTNGADKPSSESTRYLLQVFTRPLFDADTFYLEVIQRQGARGFGAGNITALWRSVKAYMKDKGLEH